MTLPHEALFAGIPAPAKGSLTVYVFGPGVGESQVVALPDGKWMVVDSCRSDGVTLPLALLQRFGVTAIDLLVVTHPDADHYRGLAELVQGIKPRHLWRYKGFHTRRDALAHLANTQPGNKRYPDLLAAHDAIAPLMSMNHGFEVAINSMPWRGGDSDPYEVTCVAPCSADLVHETVQLHELLRLVKDKVQFNESVERFLLGHARGVDGRGNPLSLALAIRWRDNRILLGGDVEAPEGEPSRGWRGIVDTARALRGPRGHGFERRGCYRLIRKISGRTSSSGVECQ